MTNLADEYRAMSKAFKEIQQRERSLADAIVLPPPTLSRSSFFSAQTALQEHLDRRRSALAEAGALVAPFRGIADSMTTIMKGFELTGIADIADNMRSLRLGFGSLKFKGDIASFCRIADLSQALVARIPISSVNEFWQVSPMKASRLIGSFEQLATKAEAFYSAWNDTKAWSIPAPARAAPVIECFNAADLLVPPTGGEELAEPMAEARHEIQKGIDDSLLGFLQQDHPDLVEILLGSRAALASPQPDGIRHFITSLRELFTQLLHRLAPDDNIKTWTTSTDDYDKGRPTRKARLRYICRGIMSPPFHDFIAKDVTASLELVGLLQGGTHAVKSTFSAPQLRALQVRVESLLRYLLEIEKEG